MPTVKNLTKSQIEKIQIDEGVIYTNFGTEKEKLFAPTRGGGEFTVTNTIRDIEYDGRRGKTKGLQVIEDQSALLKVKVLDCSQEQLALGIPGAVVQTSGGKTIITNPDNGIIPEEAYLENVVMFARLIDGTYKKISLFNAMHEGGFSFKAVQKSENEHALEFISHFNPYDTDEKLWKIEDVPAITGTQNP